MALPATSEKCQWQVNYAAYVETFDIHGQGLSNDRPTPPLQEGQSPYSPLEQLVIRVAEGGLPFTSTIAMVGECKCCDDWFVIDTGGEEFNPAGGACKADKACPEFEKPGGPVPFNTGTSPLFGKQARKYKGETVQTLLGCPGLAIDPATGEYYNDPPCKECCKGGFKSLLPVGGTIPMPEEIDGQKTADYLMQTTDSGQVQDNFSDFVKQFLGSLFCPPPLDGENMCKAQADAHENFANNMTNDFERKLTNSDVIDRWISQTWYNYKGADQRGLIPYK